LYTNKHFRIMDEGKLSRGIRTGETKKKDASQHNVGMKALRKKKTNG